LARRGAWGWHSGQAACGDLGEQVDDGAVTGGVLLEHPPDERFAFGVYLHGAVLAALIVTGADVEVADRCTHRGAAGLELLREALGDFGGEVLGV